VSENTEGLSDTELRDLMRLLRHHANTSMDQWERWRLPSSFGPVFVEMRMSPHPGEDETTYIDMVKWLQEP
jgi:hypothetical protein